MNKDTFQQMLSEMEKITRDYDDRKLKHMQYTDRVENVFINYGISKEEYYRELNNQVNGIANNPKKPVKTKKITPKKKDLPF